MKKYQPKFRTIHLSAALELQVSGADYAESVTGVHELALDLSTPERKHVYLCLESFRNADGQTLRDYLLNEYEPHLQEMLDEMCLGRIIQADDKLRRRLERIHADG